MKPVFVGKEARATLNDQEEKEEEEARDHEKKIREEKKQYTKQMVLEALQKEQEAKEITDN